MADDASGCGAIIAICCFSIIQPICNTHRCGLCNSCACNCCKCFQSSFEKDDNWGKQATPFENRSDTTNQQPQRHPEMASHSPAPAPPPPPYTPN